MKKINKNFNLSSSQYALKVMQKYYNTKEEEKDRLSSYEELIAA